jgi:hypothetical protein
MDQRSQGLVQFLVVSYCDGVRRKFNRAVSFAHATLVRLSILQIPHHPTNLVFR